MYYTDKFVDGIIVTTLEWREVYNRLAEYFRHKRQWEDLSTGEKSEFINMMKRFNRG